MSKREIIDQILQHNRGAAPEFLARFAETDLEKYLRRVSEVDTRKPTIWVRPNIAAASSAASANGRAYVMG
ncbi:MAG TPA: hypothetical protein VHQ47_04865 [Phycisphaerae bacterium]|jgi:hypothetical protein|nr:hypothetical protein [Phycisphaerae bacterium]